MGSKSRLLHWMPPHEVNRLLHPLLLLRMLELLGSPPPLRSESMTLPLRLCLPGLMLRPSMRIIVAIIWLTRVFRMLGLLAPLMPRGSGGESFSPGLRSRKSRVIFFAVVCAFLELEHGRGSFS